MTKPITFAPAALAAAAVLTTGCSLQTSARTPIAAPVTTAAASTLHGSMFGGQQPIAGASIQIYQAGTSGYGAGASGLLANGGVLTDAKGNFNITGDYTCSTGSQTYLVGTGGDPGDGVNPASVLMAGLGPCEGLSSIAFVNLNEATTIATVFALQAFLTTPTTAAVNVTGAVGSTAINVGSSSTNTVGLAQAFADINTLVNIGSGKSPGILAAGVTVPSPQIYTMANALAACVNSAGPASASCSGLLASTTAYSLTAADTTSAALSMARYPWNGVSSVVNLAGATSPFQPSLASLNDFTLGVTYTGSGINAPTSLAVDQGGNVWVANAGSNSLTQLTHTAGATPTTISAGLNAPSAVAIDQTGNLWVTNAGNSTLSALTPAGAPLSGSPFSGSGLTAPAALAVDASGNIWVANAGPVVSEFSPTGAPLSGPAGFPASGISAPTAIAIDPY
jgi:hypothetical protein